MATITKKLNTVQMHELTAVLKQMLIDSISCGGDIEWYKEASMDDYFAGCYEQLWDGDTRLGEGINTISNFFILNEDTREDIEMCFIIARYEAIKEIEEDE